MLYPKWKLTKYFRLNAYGVAASAIIICAAIFRMTLMALTYPEVNSDEGTMGIEAMHIAFQGKHPIYLYGQNYMGVLEAYIAALFFRLFGVSAFTLRIGMLMMFVLFMVAMYWLGSLLYSKKLALVSLILLSLATADMLIQQLRAVGGAIETILFGALMFILAYRLASTAGLKRTWRVWTYFAWGWTVGIALWVHILVLPFVLCSGLLILIFCYREWRSLAIPALLMGFLLGGILLIRDYASISHALLMQSGASGGSAAGVSHLLRRQVLSTLLWGIPLTTWVQPICPVTDLPYFGSGTPSVTCTLVQGGWGTGYLVLLAVGLIVAGGLCWRLWRQQSIQKSLCRRRSSSRLSCILHA